MRAFKQQIVFFLKNKLFMLFLILAATAGYAYVLTHGTCGIDDISIDLYFEVGIGVAIGRWPYYLLNKLIPIAQYTPFIADFITVILLMLAAVLWCALLRTIVGEKVSVWSYIVFTFLFLDYSMNADVFVFYLQNGLGWIHLFIVLSFVLFWNLYTRRIGIVKQVTMRMTLLVLLTVSLSFYESAASLFMTGILSIVFIDLWKNGRQSVFHGKRVIMVLIFVARYLVYAMVVRRIVRAIIMRVFAILPYTFYRSVASLDWITKGGVCRIGANISEFLANMYCDYFAVGVIYYPIFLFVFCQVVFFAALCYVGWKKKDGILVICGLGIYLSLFVLSVIAGSALEYRTCQNFTVFVALVFAGITAWFMQKEKCLRICGEVFVGVVLLYSVYDMNHWFWLDYEKTEYEMRIIDEIAEELNSGKYHISDKPIVVVGDFELPDEIYDKYCINSKNLGWKVVEAAVNAIPNSEDKITDGRYCYAKNQSSLIDWSVHAFAMYTGYNVPIRQLFEYRGHEFLWAEDSVAKSVFDRYYPLDWDYYSYTYIENYTENYMGKAQYPEEGYVEEFDNYILIRL